MAKTISVISDRSFDETKTVIPAEYARGLYVKNPPGAPALKLMHMMISKAGGALAEPRQHELRLAELRAVQGMKNHDRASLTPLFEELRSAVLSYDDPEKMRYTIGGFLDEAVIDYRNEGNGDLVIAWWFGATFRRMAEQSNHWAILDRQTIFALTSKYSILLFQHFASFANLDRKTSETFSVSKLRMLLGVQEGKLERFANLNRDALQPAIKEVNQLARFNLSATLNKVGRTVETVTISWEPKPNPVDAKRELDRAKIGRKVRREGTAETVVLAFPEAGSIRWTPWEAIATSHAPRPTPDMGLLSEKFRAFCIARNLTLTSTNIEKAFIGWVSKFKVG